MATLPDPTRLATLCMVLAPMVTGWLSLDPTVGGWVRVDGTQSQSPVGTTFAVGGEMPSPVRGYAPGAFAQVTYGTRQMDSGMSAALCVTPAQYQKTVLTQVEAEPPPDAFPPCPWILQAMS